MSIIHVIPLSTGKDSTATAILARELVPHDQLRYVSCDTGNEDDGFLPYLDYLRSELGIVIDVLRAEFSVDIERKRKFVLEKWPGLGVPQEVCEQAARALVPTGNPFLDLCLWKGQFPSRTKQFCTEQLKTNPLVEYQMGFIERGEADAVWAWQGVRGDESDKRRKLLCAANIPSYDRAFDERGGGIFNYRPILRWTAADCFEAHRIAGIEPNPLYKQGMTRVGCMPCINAGKDEVLAISKRFPGHIDRIEYWESCVRLASKKQEASFFRDPHRDAHLNKRGIRNYIEWSKTQRGGQLMDWIRIHEEPKACESAYGLCE